MSATRNADGYNLVTLRTLQHRSPDTVGEFIAYDPVSHITPVTEQ